MTAFDSTVGGANATSLGTVAGADAYFGARFGTAAWDALTAANNDAGKQKALMAATARLQMERWRGFVPSLTQALAFPRVGIYDRELRYLSSSAIPQGILNGCYELALHLLNNSTTDLMAPDQLQQFGSVRVGPVTVSPNLSAVPVWQLPPAVLRWVGPYLKSGGVQTRLVRG